jgi:hypothetical protein
MCATKAMFDFWTLGDFADAAASEEILAKWQVEGVEVIPDDRLEIEMVKAGYDPDDEAGFYVDDEDPDARGRWGAVHRAIRKNPTDEDR